MFTTIKANVTVGAKRRTIRSELRELLFPEVRKVVDRVVRTARKRHDLDPWALIERAKPKLLEACEVRPEWEDVRSRCVHEEDWVDWRMYGLSLEVLAEELEG